MLFLSHKMKILVVLSCIVVTCGLLQAQTNEFSGGWWFPPPRYFGQSSTASNYTGGGYIANDDTVHRYQRNGSASEDKWPDADVGVFHADLFDVRRGDSGGRLY